MLSRRQALVALSGALGAAFFAGCSTDAVRGGVRQLDPDGLIRSPGGSKPKAPKVTSRSPRLITAVFDESEGAVSYTVKTDTGGTLATGAQSPISIVGVEEGQPQRLKVVATNASGDVEVSGLSEPITTPYTEAGYSESYSDLYPYALTTEMPKPEVLFTGYTVFVDSVPKPVYQARVQDTSTPGELGVDMGGDYGFASFDLTHETPVRVLTHGRVNFGNVMLRGDTRSVKNLVITPNEVRFSLTGPAKLSIERDGINSPLLIFANEPDVYQPDLEDPNLFFFGPGVHEPTWGYFHLKSGQTLYIAEGAILRASVLAEGDNCVIRGRGVICSNHLNWTGVAGQVADALAVNDGSNILVEGVIVRGAAAFSTAFRHCHDVKISNVKIVGSRNINDDGVHIANSTGVHIEDCFFRTADDPIAIKGTEGYPSANPTERILIENTVLWSGGGRFALFGHEGRATAMRDIKMSNIDVIHVYQRGLVIQPTDNLVISDVVIENVKFNGDHGTNQLISIEAANPRAVSTYSTQGVGGAIERVKIRNFSVKGRDNGGSYKVVIGGKGATHPVTDVAIENLSINGAPLTRAASRVAVGEGATDIVVR